MVLNIWGREEGGGTRRPPALAVADGELRLLVDTAGNADADELAPELRNVARRPSALAARAGKCQCGSSRVLDHPWRHVRPCNCKRDAMHCQWHGARCWTRRFPSFPASASTTGSAQRSLKSARITYIFQSRARQASGRAFAFAAGAIPLFGGQLRRTQPALREVSAVPPPSCGKLDHSMFDLLLIHGY